MRANHSAKRGTAKELRSLYRFVNRHWYGDLLPAVPIKIRARDDWDEGKTLGTTYFDDDGKPTEMLILRRAPRDMCLTLIHEMIHIFFEFILKKKTKKYDCRPHRSQGKRAPWAKEVRRLAREGLLDWLL